MKFFMNFPVTDTSHTLAEYRTRFGYRALEKALSMAPTDVTKEVAASGLLGHGGAAFPAGRKWGVVKLDDGEPHYVCMNADEGEPGTFKDRWLMEYVPHMAIEGLIIGSYALRFDTSTKIAGHLVAMQTDGYRVEFLDARNGMVSAVTMADVNRIAKRLFEGKSLLVAAAGRPEGF